MPHPALWPALIGAILGGPLIILAADWIWQRWKSAEPKRRRLYVGALALFTLVYALNIYAWLIEPNTLVVRRVEIVSEHWQGAPLRIGVMSDTHVASPHVDPARMGNIVARMNALRPDIVVLLGDYVGGSGRQERRAPQDQADIAAGIATFAALNAPLGVVGIIGNHDRRYSRETIVRAMEEAGIAVLWDRNVTIARDGGEFTVAGLADTGSREYDFPAALDGAPEGDTIVLSHSPDPFPEMPREIALMLAGHAHCGQVSIPLIGRPITRLRDGQRYACHRTDENGHTLYTTAGIGTSFLPVRFLNPPEIVVITLRGPRPAPTASG